MLQGETTFFEDDEYHKIDSRKNTLVRGLIKQPNKQIIGTRDLPTLPIH